MIGLPIDNPKVNSKCTFTRVPDFAPIAKVFTPSVELFLVIAKKMLNCIDSLIFMRL